MLSVVILAALHSYVEFENRTEVAVFAAGSIVPAVLLLGYFARNEVYRTPAVTGTLLVVLAALCYVPILFFGEPWLGFPGLLAGAVLLALPRGIRAVVYISIIASVWLIVSRMEMGAVQRFYPTLQDAVVGLVFYGLAAGRSYQILLADTRRQVAELAVTRERLRIARDLHDIIGSGLSAVVLKSDLALELLESDPPQAARELRDSLHIARRSLTDVRSVVATHRAPSLDTELAAARQLLATTGADVRVSSTASDLTPRVAAVVATVIREGATNIIRHSSPQSCELVVDDDGCTVMVTLTNNGVHIEPTRCDGGGDGVRNLAARVEAVGGSLRVKRDVAAATFTLAASIPHNS